jgi:hypothetical protein
MNHSYFLLSSNGFLWNGNKSEENEYRHEDYVKFENGNKIVMNYSNENLKFRIGNREFKLTQVSDENYRLYPCVIFLNMTDDQITFI